MSTTREQILERASELMWRRGYTRTSVDEIIESAGVCKGSFYHHFASKDALGLAVIECWAENFAIEIMSRVSESNTPLENLDAMLDTTAETQRENGYQGCPLGRLALEMGDSSDAFRQRLDVAFDNWRGLAAGYLKQAGMTRREAAEYAGYMLATLEGGLMLMKIAGRGAALEAHVEQMKSGIRRRFGQAAA